VVSTRKPLKKKGKKTVGVLGRGGKASEEEKKKRWLAFSCSDSEGRQR